MYWHSEAKSKENQRHKVKFLKCQSQGIRLITIYENEWLHSKEKVKNFILTSLGIFKQRVYARKTELRQIDRKIASSFLNNTHLQGSGKIEVAFGLFLGDVLVGVMTGAKHHRSTYNGQFCLNRMAFLDGSQIVGGASKLLKGLVDYAKKQGYKEIVSWSDNRWSDGNVYNKLGFKLSKELPADYCYVTDFYRAIVQSKQANKKNELSKKGAVGTTEKEMAESLGYFRIWDCGKKTWIYSI